MNRFEMPEVQVIMFANEDVITTSGTQASISEEDYVVGGETGAGVEGYTGAGSVTPEM